MILVFGATGLVGEYVVSRLAEKCNVRCFIRRSSNIENLKQLGSNVHFFYGDLNEDFDKIKSCGEGISAIISIVNIRNSVNILKIAEHFSIKRAILISTTGRYSQFQQYSKEYIDREKDVLESNLDYTILRPTMIYGDKRDKNIHKIVLKLTKHKVFPIFGDGSSKFQPVYYKDVGDAIISCFNNDATIKKCYNISGKTVISYNDMLKLIAEKLNRKVYFIKTGFTLAYLIAAVSSVIPLGYKLKLEQIDRLKEDKVFGYNDAANDFGYNPLSFEEGIIKQLESMGFPKFKI